MAKGCGKNNNSCSNKNTFNRQRTGDGDAEFVAPDIIVSTYTLGYGNSNIGFYAELSYNVRAVGLTGDMYINNTNPYAEVSIDNGANWAGSYYVTPNANGKIPEFTVKTRFIAKEDISYEGFINHIAAGATTESIDWTGLGVYDADALAWFNTHLVQLGTQFKEAWNIFVTGCKADGNWSEIDRLWCFATEKQQQAKICTKSLVSLTEVGAISWTTKQGYKGDGVSTYLNSNFTPSVNGVKFTLNSASFGVYCRSNTQSTAFDIGGAGTGGSSAITSRNASDQFGLRFNGPITLDVFTNTNSSGLIAARRPNSTTVEALRNGTVLGLNGARNSTALPPVNIYICARNNNGTAAGFSSREYSMAFFGSALVDITKLYNRFQTFMTFLGTQV